MEFLKINDMHIPTLDDTYRAVVVEAYECEYSSGCTFFIIEYFIFVDNQTFNFTEEIANIKNNLRTEDFFRALNCAGITFENVEELRGLVIDANLTVEVFQGKPHLLLSNKKIVLKPPTKDSEVLGAAGSEECSFWT